MAVIRLKQSESGTESASRASESIPSGSERMNWVGLAAGGALVAGGFLLLAGRRRAGMVAAASGTALALLDQQETLRSWWGLLPGYIDSVQQLVGQVESAVDEIAVKREKLGRIELK